MTLTEDGGMEWPNGDYLDRADVEGLEQCIAIYRQESADAAKDIDSRFAAGQDLWEVGGHACFSVQIDIGKLTSEQVPPSFANASNNPDERKFYRKLIRYGVSPFIPDPWTGLKAAIAARGVLESKGLRPAPQPPKRKSKRKPKRKPKPDGSPP